MLINRYKVVYIPKLQDKIIHIHMLKDALKYRLREERMKTFEKPLKKFDEELKNDCEPLKLLLRLGFITKEHLNKIESLLYKDKKLPQRQTLENIKTGKKFDVDDDVEERLRNILYHYVDFFVNDDVYGQFDYSPIDDALEYLTRQPYKPIYEYNSMNYLSENFDVLDNLDNLDIFNVEEEDFNIEARRKRIREIEREIKNAKTDEEKATIKQKFYDEGIIGVDWGSINRERRENQKNLLDSVLNNPNATELDKAIAKSSYNSGTNATNLEDLKDILFK